MNIYWGDLHNHCGISYGFGGLENALDAAREQLDFCTITGHAMWPDMPKRTKDLEFLVDFHTKGFEKLRNNWENIRKTVADANKPGEFVTFQGYEIHSSEYGDHHICSASDDIPLIESESPEKLVKNLAPNEVIAIPHHIGYTPGYRGITWGKFVPEISPVVEVFSKHGCGISEDSLYPYLHTMGPRDSRSTAYSGLLQGYRFGFAASTDHHAGYPGSYGDGRLAVLAEEKTRESIFEAIRARRTYAVTGDKIACRFNVNGTMMGGEVRDIGKRNIYLDVRACDSIDKITILKNAAPWKIINGEMFKPTKEKSDKYKVRIEMGWGNNKEGFLWNGNVKVKGGCLESIEQCFRGRSVLAPAPEMRDNPDINKIINKVTAKTENSVEWICTTFANPSTTHPQTNAIIVEVNGNEDTMLEVSLNERNTALSIGDLLKGGITGHMFSYNSQAFIIHKAVQEYKYCFTGEWTDTERETDNDFYHVEIRQVNNQFAWISPVFIV